MSNKGAAPSLMPEALRRAQSAPGGVGYSESEEAYMAKRMSDRVVESTVNQLVEAEQRQSAARAELERFKATYPRPEPPGAFPNLRVFLDYHRARSGYEDEVEKREKALATAEASYRQAAEQLQDVLPENVPLNHDYRNIAYVIVKRQGEVNIEERGPSTGP